MFTLIFLVSIASNPVQQYGVDSGHDFDSMESCLNYASSSFGQAELRINKATAFDCVPTQD